MNKYEFTCNYCGYVWEVNYTPTTSVFCHKCNDSDVKLKDLHRDKIDYYAGSPEFPTKNKPEDWQF